VYFVLLLYKLPHFGGALIQEVIASSSSFCILQLYPDPSRSSPPFKGHHIHVFAWLARFLQMIEPEPIFTYTETLAERDGQ